MFWLLWALMGIFLMVLLGIAIGNLLHASINDDDTPQSEDE